MGASIGQSDLLAARYATAFLDVAEAQKLTTKVEKDMATFGAMIEASPELKQMVRNPLFGRQEKTNAVLELAKKAKVQKLTQNFLQTLVENRRLRKAPEIVRAFQTELNRRRGIQEANVVSAYALSAAQTKELTEKLGKAMGSNVTLNVSVDTDLLGGMVITVGSRMIDDSVRSKLDRLQRVMKKGSNTNQIQVKEVS